MGGWLLAAALWLALGLLVVGVAGRLVTYLRTPQRLPLPLAPAPTGWAGVAARLALELFAFRSLYRADRMGWLLGWVFHASLALVVVRHRWLLAEPPAWIAPLVPLGPWLSAALAGSLLALLVRRVIAARLRYISVPSDYLWLVYLLGLVGSGVVLGHLRPQALAEGIAFSRGLLGAGALPSAPDPALWVHGLLAAGLLGIFPFSKLLHAPGLLVTPTFAARDRRGSSSGG